MDNIINKLCKALKMNQVEFANKLGVTQSSISQIRAKNKISSRMMATICAVFPHVNRRYLETGEGPVFLDSSATLANERASPYSPYKKEIEEMIAILVEVMQSDNETVKEALKQNLVAFQFAVRAGKERDILKTIANPGDGTTISKKG